MLSVRNKHLQQIARLVRQGGYGIVIVDLVSSVTCDELKPKDGKENEEIVMNESECRKLLAEVESVGNHFHGVNSAKIVQQLKSRMKNMGLENVESVNLIDCWLWDIGVEEKRYLVYAVSFLKRAEEKLEEIETVSDVI